jgi:hypothetical protein
MQPQYGSVSFVFRSKSPESPLKRQAGFIQGAIHELPLVS